MRAFPSFILPLLVLSAPRAGEWELVAPAPVASHLRALALAPDGHPVAMGNFGNAAYAEAGGAIWKPLALPTARTIGQVVFRDGIGHAVGLGGTLLVSVDGGRVWTAAAAGTQADLHGVDFLDGLRGAACGKGVLLGTDNGGSSWRVLPAGAGGNFNRVKRIGARTLVAAGWGGIWRSVDGGATLGNALPHAIPFESLDFADSLNGYAASYATVWRTRNGGATWDSVFFTSVITGVQAFGPDSVLVFGPSGVRASSRDGGATWATDFDWEPRDMLATRFADARLGYGVGNHGNIHVTVDGGRTWSARHRSNPIALLGPPRFFDGRVGYAPGAGGPLRSEDGGLSWRADTGAVAALARNGFHCVNERTGFGAGNAGTLVRTDDAGRTWRALRVPTARPLASVWFTHPDTGWVVGKGADGPIFKSVDGGATWQEQSNPSGAALTNIRFRDSRRGYALAGYDQLLTTHNGGRDWTASSLRFPHASDYLELEGNETLYARGVSDSGSILLKSSNGGVSWSAIPFADGIHAFRFNHPDTGYAVGATLGPERQGVILRTVDGGISWTRTETGTPELDQIFFPAPGSWVALGPNGTVLKRDGEPNSQGTALRRRGAGGTGAWKGEPGRFSRPGDPRAFDALGISLLP